MSKTAPREIELKLRLTPEELEAALARPVIAAAGASPQRRRLRTVYWDTRNRDLAAAGIALRIRDLGGSRVQTVKAARDSASALVDVLEDEQPIASERPNPERIRDATLREAVSRTVGRRRLKPIYETDVDRREWRIEPADGCVLSVAADIGTVRAADREAPLCELEIEVREGSAAAVFDFAREVLDTLPLRLETRTKAERGVLLANGADLAAPRAPEPARLPRLAAGMTVEEGLQAALRSCLRQIAVNILACAEDTAPEAPHQLRIGLRRLRSVLRIFRTLCSGETAQLLANEAAWLAAEAGPARDVHVFGAEIVSPARLLDPEGGASRTGYDRLEAARAAGMERAASRLASALDDPRARSLILNLGVYAEGKGWRKDVPAIRDVEGVCAADLAHFASGALQRLWRKVEKRARDIDALDETQRHELRKSLKKLRYGAELFAPLFPRKRVRHWIKALKTLQDVFGYLNDVAVARSLLAELAPPDGEDRTVARVHGLILGVHAARADAAWADAKSRWQALAGTRPFWD